LGTLWALIDGGLFLEHIGNTLGLNRQQVFLEQFGNTLGLNRRRTFLRADWEHSGP
jgi:hypothetical protein